MSSDDANSPGNERLSRIVAGYLEATEACEAPDRQELLDGHPDLADDLRSFFTELDKMKELAEPTQPAGEGRSGDSRVEQPTLSPRETASERPLADASTLSLSPTELADAATLPPSEAIGASADRPPPVGTKICYFGDYELLEEIARGGMGVVYKARQLSLNRIVALKMILAGQFASEADVQRFHAEAKAAANLQHPGIVAIHEVGVYEDQHYFSMDYIQGQSLSDLLSHGPLPPAEAAGLVRTVAEAVHYAHQHGVIHRDLKPANVLLDEQGHPRVTDFGLAKLVTAKESLTATGAVMGTPGYMPPEQASGGKQVGPAADVYSLGATLYALVTGRPPFRAGADLDALLLVLEGEPIPPRRLNRAVDRNLETICLKCLEKDPRRRYGSALEMAEDLGRYLDGDPIVARPLGPWGRLNRWARRCPALAATLVALALFYANHVFACYVLKAPGEGEAFHMFATGLVLVWGTGAAMFQYMARRPKAGSAVTYGWAGMDVLMFTAFLYAASGPKSTVLFGYLLLVAGAGLRFRSGLVWFVTILCMSGYVWLVIEAHWHRPQLAPAPKAILPFLMSLVIMGLIVHFILRRIRRLSSSQAARETRGQSRTRGALGGGSRLGRAVDGDLEPTKPG